MDELLSVELDEFTSKMAGHWIAHRKAKPDIPADYAAEVDHLRSQMDYWQSLDNAWRTLLGARVTGLILDAEGLDG
ncbi:hypothetical protein SEA_PUPPER_8 [Gordonia phage Pupper]|uniref:Uncharacterized protein n=1 Tax=Gordonia phage Pupper TaxID=2571249 RepID=A0A4Y6EKD3_9CAUD|nr:hypothetical protein KHQ83_gp008 [Gordonia phage Pupper]QDF18495.1 hypothetical protein SEA_PUPPER_8 [Gordonia phage Pupper]QDF18728.1 hypothetical protein SEA_SCENTAE_8 [Gordonia phage SCentae]